MSVTHPPRRQTVRLSLPITIRRRGGALPPEAAVAAAMSAATEASREASEFSRLVLARQDDRAQREDRALRAWSTQT